MLSSLALAVLALATPAADATPHPFTVHDLVAFDRLSDLQPSPDGTRILVTISALDLDANRRRTDLWTMASDGTGLSRLTDDPASDTQGRWSPDGSTVYFLSTRGGSSQVWAVPAAGGAARAVTDLPVDVEGFGISPDGSRLVLALDVFVDCPTLACTRERLDRKDPSSARAFDRLFIRHWDTWEDGRRQHLWAVPAAGGEPVDLTRGLDADAPTRPFGGLEECAFTPDGKALVFTARSAAGSEQAWSTNLDLWVVPVDGSAAPRVLTGDNPAADTAPAFSPDGRTLAWLAQSRPGYESDRYRILLRSWPDGPTREVAARWDRSAGTLRWAGDGTALLVTADHLGNRPVFAIDPRTGAAHDLSGAGTVADPGWAAGRVLFLRNDLSGPAEVYSVRPDGGDLRKLTAVNAPRLATVRLGVSEQMTFPGANGETVHAWVTRPAGFDPSRKYPVALLIHGGPQGSFGNEFHYRWNPQPYAGRGYAALMVDFHGSTGYGQAFTDAIRNDWGGKPLEDLRRGLEAALASYPWMDGERVCALGASYGGYMVDWIAGAWPDRFRCLVSHDGTFNELHAYYDTEELWFPEWEHGGTPWANPQAYVKHSPHTRVDRWKTPMLVIHGGLDFRVVETQGIAAFTALQRRGIPSRFLHFPDENHWVLKPRNSIRWHEEVLGWLDRWTAAP